MTRMDAREEFNYVPDGVSCGEHFHYESGR